jgi:predicted CopG family antitoxin
MSQQIMLDDKIYCVLAEMKKNISGKASFNTVLAQMIRYCAGSEKTELKFLEDIREFRQLTSIRAWIQDMSDHNLINERVSDFDLIPLMILMMNGQWIKMDELLHAKAEMIRDALRIRDENLELVARHQVKKAKSRGSSGEAQDGVQNAKDGTSQTRK